MNLWHKNSSPESAFIFPIALQAKVTGAYESTGRVGQIKAIYYIYKNSVSHFEAIWLYIIETWSAEQVGRWQYIINIPKMKIASHFQTHY